jgi:hypothetical protein
MNCLTMPMLGAFVPWVSKLALVALDPLVTAIAIPERQPRRPSSQFKPHISRS